MEAHVGRLLDYWEAAATDVPRVGVELELLPLRPDGRRITFEGAGGIGSWFEHLRDRGWRATQLEDGSLDSVASDPGMLSVELGCQLEMSLSPSRSLEGQTARYESMLRALAGVGADPRSLRAEGYDLATPPGRLPRFPTRSLILEEAARRSDSSCAFLQRSAAAHLNINFRSLEDLDLKLRGAVALAPFGVALASAMRMAAGGSGPSVRTDHYLQSLPERAGCFGVSAESRDALATFARRVVVMPLIYRQVARDGKKEWVPCRNESLASGRIALDEALRQVMTAVRVQRVLEIRFLDSQPWGQLIKLLGLIGYLLGEEAACRSVVERLECQSEDEWRDRLWRAADPEARFVSADREAVIELLSELQTIRHEPELAGADVEYLLDTASRQLGPGR